MHFPFLRPGPRTNIEFSYQPLTLSAGAFSVVTKGDIPFEISGSIVVVVAVSNADGTPLTGLSKEDFTVQLFGPGGIPAPSQFILLAPLPTPSNAHVLAVFRVPESGWGRNSTYAVLVEVRHASENGPTGPIAIGRAVTTAQVPYEI